MNINKVRLCFGCGACSQICPYQCIKIVQDAEGFYAAEPDTGQCTDCGRCLRVCPMEPQNTSCVSKTGEIYAAVNKNHNMLLRSASGGMFSAFAEWILNQGGRVFGCGYDSSLNVCHYYIDSPEGLDKLRRSKYVQSDTRDTFLEVKVFLLKGYKVLYVGTPCQIAGLKLYLRKNYENLFTVDLLCHGVPSPKMFKNNLSYLEDKYGKKISNYEFRLKNDLNTRFYSFLSYSERGSAHRSTFMIRIMKRSIIVNLIMSAVMNVLMLRRSVPVI